MLFFAAGSERPEKPVGKQRVVCISALDHNLEDAACLVKAKWDLLLLMIYRCVLLQSTQGESTPFSSVKNRVKSPRRAVVVNCCSAQIEAELLVIMKAIQSLKVSLNGSRG